MTAPTSDAAGIRQVIRALVAAGWTLSYVNDGEERVQVRGVFEALAAITDVDFAHLFVDSADGTHGFVCFVLGNDPEEVAADWTANLEPVLGPLTQGWWE